MSATKNINAEKIQGSLTADTINIQTLGSGTSVTNLGIDSSGNVVTGTTGGGGDNFYVTGFTYDDTNTFTISQNGGLGDLTSTINNVTGLTVNGTLVVDTISATTINGSVSGLTLNDLDDVTSNIPTTPDNTYQGRLLYFDVTDNQWITGEEYVSTGNVTIWAKKGTAGTIDKGCPVYITGFDNDIHEVELANATTASTMPVIGFTGEDFDNAGVYPLITFGKLVGVDTTSTVSTINPNGETWAVNDVLYMNTTDGGLTKFRPPGTNTQIQRIAKVLRVATTSGQLFIFNTARTAGLPNLTTDYLWLGNGNDTPQEVIRTDVGITTTGFTYNDNNTFTITDDNGGSFSSTINQMSGLTINGDLDVTTITDLSYIDFNITATTTHQEGRVRWDGDVKTLLVDTNQQISIQVGQQMYLRGVNKTGSQLDKGLMVVIDGVQGNRPTLDLATNSDGYVYSKTIGIMSEDTSNNQEGYVITNGIIHDVDTSPYSAGTELFLSTGGTITDVTPISPDRFVRIGQVVVSHATEGSIYIRIINGFQLSELHDVKISGVTNGDLITYDSTDDIWINSKTLTGDYTINGDLDVTGDTTLNTLTATSITSNSAINVFNGHINLRDNSYFLQGRTVADANVSLIGVDNQDRVFIGNAGYDTFIDSDTIVDGSLTATTLNITTIGGGAPVGNLGFDSNGQVVTGTTAGGDSNSTVENFYYSISNSVDTRPIFEDTNVLFNWDETGNDLEFQMKVAPGGIGDMRSLAYLVGGSTQNTFITTTGVNYDVYTAGVSSGNRLEVFITAENDVTYPAYHVIVYNTGESVENTVWIQRITRN